MAQINSVEDWKREWSQLGGLQRVIVLCVMAAVPLAIISACFAFGYGALIVWLLLTLWIVRFVFGLVFGMAFATGGAAAPVIHATITGLRTTKPVLYWCLQLSSRISSAVRSNSLLFLWVGLAVTVGWPGRQMGSKGLPPMFGIPNVYALALLFYPSVTLETLLALTVASAFPSTSFALGIYIVLVWISLMLHMVSLLLPSAGMRDQLFGVRFHPLLMLAGTVLLQGIAVVVTTAAAVAAINGTAFSMPAMIAASVNLAALVGVSLSPSEVLDKARALDVSLLSILSVGLWSLLSTRLLVACVFGKRTEEELRGIIGGLLVWNRPNEARKFTAKMPEVERQFSKAICLLALGEVATARAAVRHLPTAESAPQRQQPDLFLFSWAGFISGYPGFSELVRCWLSSKPSELWALYAFGHEASEFRPDQRSAFLTYATDNDMFTLLGRLVDEGDAPGGHAADQLCPLNPALYISQLTFDSIRMLTALGSLLADPLAQPDAIAELRHRIALLLDPQVLAEAVDAVVARRSMVELRLTLLNTPLYEQVYLRAGGVCPADYFQKLHGRVVQGLRSLANDNDDGLSITDLQATLREVLDQGIDAASFRKKPSLALVLKRPELILDFFRLN